MKFRFFALVFVSFFSSASIANAAFTITSPNNMPAMTDGEAFPTTTITTSGGTAPITFSVSAGTLPTGLSLASGTGKITGTPITSGAYNFTIQAKDKNNLTTTQNYTDTIAPAITFTPTNLPAMTKGEAIVSTTISTTGGNGTVTLSATGLPAGLTFSGGVLAGTPTVTGTHSITITATDASGTTKHIYSFTISAAITFTPANLPTMTAGETMTPTTITTTGGNGGVTLSATGLPTGLTFTSGILAGTPAVSGAYSIIITATDDSGSTTKTYSGNIASTITFDQANLNAMTAGESFSQTITITGGSGTVTLSASGLPDGLTFTPSSKKLAGTPTVSGPYSITITATDNSGSTSNTYTDTIAPAITFTPTNLPAMTKGEAIVSTTISTTGGNGTVTLSATGLPAGLTFSGGVLAGTPTGTGAYNITITATDASGTTKQIYSGTIATAIAFAPASLPTMTAGETMTPTTITTTGGNGGVTLSATGLPTGLTFTSGILAGTPAVSGAYSIIITATDDSGSTTKTYSGNIASTITFDQANLNAMTAGESFSQTITITGGSGTVTLSASGLPDGLTFTPSSKKLAGTPTVSGPYSITITATDNSGSTSNTYTDTIAPAITFTPTNLPAMTKGEAIVSTTISTTGGNGTVTLSATGLPAGLTFSGGVLAGTPTVTGTHSITITATDASGTTKHIYSFTISAAITFTPTSLPAMTAGETITPTTITTSSNGSVTLSATGLPTGLTFTSGVLAGTPTVSGAYSIIITATDNNGSIQKTYTGNIAAAITFSPTTLNTITAGESFSQTITTTGGSGTVTLSASGLPAGLTFSGGVLSGTPTSSGSYSIIITATDSDGSTQQTYTGNIATGASITTKTLPTPVIGQNYNQTITVSGTIGTLTYSVINGTLPAGLSLNSTTGVISGIPTTAGNYSFTLQIKDAGGSITQTYSGSIAARPDPVKDPTVVNTVNSQVTTIQQFSQAQVYNVSTHIVDLHQQFSPNFNNFTKGFNFQGINMGNVFNGDPVDTALNMMTQAALSSGIESPPNQRTYGNNSSQVSKSTTTKNDSGYTNTAIWIAGTLNYGSLSTNGQKNKFSTSGLSFGMDYKLNKNIIAGAAIGYGFDNSKIDQFGTRSKSRNGSVSIYGSYRPRKSFFFDALLGYGRLSSNNSRWIANDNVLAHGTRKGNNLFGYLAFTKEFKKGNKMIAPFIQGDFIMSKLNAYKESGTSLFLLSYDQVKINTTALTLGVSGSYDHKLSYGTLTPFTKLQYLRRFNIRHNQRIYYSDIGISNNPSSLSPIVLLQDVATAQVGLRYLTHSNISSVFSYNLSRGSNAYIGHSFKLGLQFDF